MKFKLKNTLLALAAFALIGGIAAGASTFFESEAIVAKADEELLYTLDPIMGKNSNYNSSEDVEIDGVTWNVEGNVSLVPWRIGGKSISNQSRKISSKAAVSDFAVTRVVLSIDDANDITVNSLTLNVGSAYQGADVSSVSGEFAANSEIIFECPEGKDWLGSFFTFDFNVSVSDAKNKSVLFAGAEFYGDTTPADPLAITIDGEMTKRTYTTNETWDPTGLTVSAKHESGDPYEGGFTFFYAPETPRAMGIGENQTLKVTAKAKTGETATIEQTVTVVAPEVEGLIPDGSSLYIAATRDKTTYYLHANTDPNKVPLAVTDIKDATPFLFNLVADNEYEIVTYEGDYLFAISDSKGVRVGSTEDTWTIEEGVSTMSGAYNFTASNGRVLTLYAGQDWRCYTSATADNRKENTDVVAAPNVKALLNEWIGSYMHMDDADYEGTGTGLCVSAGTYVAAKAALIALGDECIYAFSNDSGKAYTDALARYTAWAAAAGDTSPFAGEGIIKGSNSLLIGEGSYKAMAISALAVLLGLAGVAGMVVIAKRHKKA